jgi:hypothetical protein
LTAAYLFKWFYRFDGCFVVVAHMIGDWIAAAPLRVLVYGHSTQAPIVCCVRGFALRSSGTVSFTKENSWLCFVYLVPTN